MDSDVQDIKADVSTDTLLSQSHKVTYALHASNLFGKVWFTYNPSSADIAYRDYESGN